MNAFSFGSYYPGESPLHRLDPRAKLLLGCAFIVVALCARNVAALGAVAVFVAAFYLASRIPVSYTHLQQYLRHLLPLLSLPCLPAYRAVSFEYPQSVSYTHLHIHLSILASAILVIIFIFY